MKSANFFAFVLYFKKEMMLTDKATIKSWNRIKTGFEGTDKNRIFSWTSKKNDKFLEKFTFLWIFLILRISNRSFSSSSSSPSSSSSFVEFEDTDPYLIDQSINHLTNKPINQSLLIN